MACPHMSFIRKVNFPLKLLKLIFNRSEQTLVNTSRNSLFISVNEGAGQFWQTDDAEETMPPRH